jgi:hypothetical protein
MLIKYEQSVSRRFTCDSINQAQYSDRTPNGVFGYDMQKRTWKNIFQTHDASQPGMQPLSQKCSKAKEKNESTATRTTEGTPANQHFFIF